jgi:S1-C subfamily serine protease
MSRDKVKPVRITSTNDSDQFTLDRPSIAWAVENQDSLLHEVTLQDYASGGIQITSIAPGSLASDFGLQQGDVVKSVNGQPVVSSLSLNELRNSEAIKRATALTVGIERAGQVRALVIRQGPGGPPK